jgi:hypothetical protein
MSKITTNELEKLRKKISRAENKRVKRHLMKKYMSHNKVQWEFRALKTKEALEPYQLFQIISGTIKNSFYDLKNDLPTNKTYQEIRKMLKFHSYAIIAYHENFFDGENYGLRIIRNNTEYQACVYESDGKFQLFAI